MFFKAWTAPKRLETPRSASTVPVATGVGVTVIDSAPERFVHGRHPGGAPGLLRAGGANRGGLPYLRPAAVQAVANDAVQMSVTL
ncbi:hypothetical protein GCM10028799_26100 [Kribbella italica]